MVEKAPGFCSLEVLTDSADPSVFLLLTRWGDAESFRSWHRSEGHHQSHELIPKGLKLDPSFTSLTIGNTIQDSAGIQSLSDALVSRPVAFSHWLMESEVLFGLLLAPDGTIRDRNRAACQTFPPNPEKNFGLSIWDYLVCSDCELRQRLADSESRHSDCLLLNLCDGQQNPISLEVELTRCTGAIILLGTQERRHDSHFQAEILAQTNSLSVLMREGARKNRELQEANETIERLARTDALTGLANRRTLQESLLVEIARAERLGQGLSVIMGDLDRFKSINDQHGHLAGDQVLATAAAVFGSQLRPYDLAARYGGEEFLLLLPGTSTDDAATIAERVRADVAKLKVPACPRQITISLGVASWRIGEGPEEFVARADAALYHAKNSGRNRVEVATEIQV